MEFDKLENTFDLDSNYEQKRGKKRREEKSDFYIAPVSFLDAVDSQKEKLEKIIATLKRQEPLHLADYNSYLQKLLSVSRKILSLTDRQLQPLPEMECKHVIVKSDVVIEEYSKGVLKYTFEGKLPHRETLDIYHKTVHYSYNKTELFNRFFNAALAFRVEHEDIFFHEKTMAYIITYHNDEGRVFDLENMDLKYFIDGGLLPFLPDDDNRHLTFLMDSGFDEYEHTEVYFGVFDEVNKLVGNVYVN